VRRVKPARSLAWLAEGWAYFLGTARSTLLLTAMLLGATLLAALLANMRSASVLFSMLMVVYLGLLAGSCRNFDDGGPLLLFPRDIVRSKTLWIVAALAGAITLALDLLSNSMSVYAHAASWSGLGLYFLFVKSLSLLALMALWLAPALVVLHGAGPLRAMKLSLLGSLKNFLPWLLFSLLAFVFLIVAAIPVGLGLLAALPTLAGAAYLAWQDLFN
jgi:hypothetical protein